MLLRKGQGGTHFERPWGTLSGQHEEITCINIILLFSWDHGINKQRNKQDEQMQSRIIYSAPAQTWLELSAFV